MKKGWDVRPLGEACQIRPPKAEARRQLSETDLVSFVPMEDLGINQKFLVPTKTRPLADVAGSYTYFANGDVLLAKITPCFENGKLGIATDLANGIGFGSSEYIVFRPADTLDKNWLYYFLSLDSFRAKGAKSMGGAVGHKRVSKDFIDSCPIPVPPLAEQERIVALLDEAFAGIATAKAHAERNLQNARALFESHLNAIFTQRGEGWVEGGATDSTAREEIVHYNDLGADRSSHNGARVTKTGGRNATLRHIPGRCSLSVCEPRTSPNAGWRWSPLLSLARLESGHTPSRRHPEWWDGNIPWIGIKDARGNHGRQIYETLQYTNPLGIANSAARILPKGTVCLSRTASVGYVVVMGCEMSTSQDFVNWVCSSELIPDFLKYVFLAEGREGLLKFASGSVHQTIYFPEAKAFYVCHPETDTQRAIVDLCDEISKESQRLQTIYQRKIDVLDELKRSILREAFSGNL